jgi:hypothetical protein
MYVCICICIHTFPAELIDHTPSNALTQMPTHTHAHTHTHGTHIHMQQKDFPAELTADSPSSAHALSQALQSQTPQTEPVCAGMTLRPQTEAVSASAGETLSAQPQRPQLTPLAADSEAEAQTQRAQPDLDSVRELSDHSANCCEVLTLLALLELSDHSDHSLLALLELSGHSAWQSQTTQTQLPTPIPLSTAARYSLYLLY